MERANIFHHPHIPNSSYFQPLNISGMKKWIAIGIVIIFPFLAFAQTNGKWNFSMFEGGIVKSTFTPNEYHRNEQVSNAVILAPMKNASTKTHLLKSDDGKIFYFLGKDTVQLLHYFDSGFYKGFQFRLADHEKIFGTGERSVPLDRRGFKLPLYNGPNYGYGMNTDYLNYSVPFILSSKGYAIFFDNPSRGYLDIGKSKTDILEYGASSGELTFYIIPGKNASEILKKYHQLVGTQPIPARWVFGNFMSRFGYRSQSQLTSIVNKMNEEKIPVDAVIIDLFWFGDSIKGTMGNLEWNKKSWPEPEKMIANFKKEGIQTILITEPYVLNTTPNYAPSKKYHAVDSVGKPYLLTDFYFGNGGLLDLFRTDAQKWFWSKYKKQIGKGVAGWWGDLGEPERHPADVYHQLKDVGYNRLFSADEIHNIYGHYWDKMLFDFYKKEYPQVRLFNLNRSGYAGSPRYGVFPWSGDVGRSWSGLQAQLPVMLGMSLSGIPYIHADAGGFAMGEGDPELYTRWLQFAAFTPVFRPHGTAVGELDKGQLDIPSEAALYPDPYKKIVRNYIQFRYSLLPYNYTLGYEQAKFGKPLARPLFYEQTSDSNLYAAENEYLWGQNILVAPVIAKKQNTRTLYLPQGNWYNYHTGAQASGGDWITQRVFIDDIPLFVKAGTFLPLANFSSLNAIRNTNDYDDKNLIINYYPSSENSNYSLYLDDGKTNGTLEKGKYGLLHFQGVTTMDEVHITITSMGDPVYKNAHRLLNFTVPGYDIQYAIISGKEITPKKGNILKYAMIDSPVSYVPIDFRGKEMRFILKIKPR